MTALFTTFDAIRAHGPCGIQPDATTGFRKLVNHCGVKTDSKDKVAFWTILESNGLDDALWCLRALPPEMDNAVRLLVCDLVEPAMRFVPEDVTRLQETLRVARAFARGEATREQLATARDAACDVWWEPACNTVSAAAWAAMLAAYEVARDAARGAAMEALWAAEKNAEGGSMYIVEQYAVEVARDAALDEQERIFREWLTQMEAGS